jgi:hypothetical protein
VGVPTDGLLVKPINQSTCVDAADPVDGGTSKGGACHGHFSTGPLANRCPLDKFVLTPWYLAISLHTPTQWTSGPTKTPLPPGGESIGARCGSSPLFRRLAAGAQRTAELFIHLFEITAPGFCQGYLAGKRGNFRQIAIHNGQGDKIVKTQATSLYPFVPAGTQFERSLDFFAALGFEKQWQQEGRAGLRFGGAYFILQNIEVPEWQKNQMITFEVTDLDAYWAELGDLAGRFPGVKLRPPTNFAWGREVHIIDLAGVCWHVRQAERPAFGSG